MLLFLDGAIAMGFCSIAAFFIRYWLATKDRFFLIFACSFVAMAVNRVLVAHQRVPDANEADIIIYVMRLAAYSLLIIAILDKNRVAASGPTARSIKNT